MKTSVKSGNRFHHAVNLYDQQLLIRECKAYLEVKASSWGWMAAISSNRTSVCCGFTEYKKMCLI